MQKKEIDLYPKLPLQTFEQMRSVMLTKGRHFLGPILQNFDSAENFSYKFSPANFRQIGTQKITKNKGCYKHQSFISRYFKAMYGHNYKL
jgi:hypothetical protein